MRLRGKFSVSLYEAKLRKLLDSLGDFTKDPATFLNVHAPHQPIEWFTPERIEQLRFMVARQAVREGRPNLSNLQLDAETQAMLDSWGPNSPSPNEYARPRTAKKVRKPLQKKRRKRRPPKGGKRPRTAHEWLEQAAKVVTERRIAAGEELDFNSAYSASLSELERGFFNPRHWSPCDRLDVHHLQNTPTTGPDTKHRSYAYPDPANKRTLATYGDGSESTGPPRYNGNTLSGEFRDSLLVWSRETFQLVNEIPPGAIEPTFIDIQGQIRAYANRRGSRPMLSYIVKTWLCAAGSDKLTTTQPPTVKPWSFYYRYKVPHSGPPYYAQEDAKRGIKTMCQKAHMELDATCEQAVVLMAPRPMYGRGFNNNTDVTTQLIANATLWQIDIKPPDARYELIQVFILQQSRTGDTISNGDPVNFQIKGRFFANVSWRPVLQTDAQSSGLLAPVLMETFLNDATAALGTVTGATHISASDKVVPCTSTPFGTWFNGSIGESPWLPAPVENVYEWATANNFEVGIGPILFAFAWLKWENRFIKFKVSDFIYTSTGNFTLNRAALEPLRAYGRPIFIGTTRV